jgi:hypothetical protein
VLVASAVLGAVEQELNNVQVASSAALNQLLLRYMTLMVRETLRKDHMSTGFYSGKRILESFTFGVRYHLSIMRCFAFDPAFWHAATIGGIQDEMVGIGDSWRSRVGRGGKAIRCGGI